MAPKLPFFVHHTKLRQIYRAILVIFEFPLKFITIYQFVKQRKALWGDFRVGEWVRLKELPKDVTVMLGPQVQESIPERNMGEKDERGLREMKVPTLIKGTASYLLFVDRVLFEIVEVNVSEIWIDIYFYLRYRNINLGHPCSLAIRNKEAILGENTIRWVMGELFEKVEPR